MADDGLKELGLKALRVTSIVLLLSLVIFTHERELVPLYASVPTTYLLKKVVFSAAIASAAHPIRVSLKRNLLYTALALTLAPNATYWIAVYTARWKDPMLGPTVTHLTTLAPLVFLLTTFVVEMEDTEVCYRSVRMYSRHHSSCYKCEGKRIDYKVSASESPTSRQHLISHCLPSISSNLVTHVHFLQYLR